MVALIYAENWDKQRMNKPTYCFHTVPNNAYWLTDNAVLFDLTMSKRLPSSSGPFSTLFFTTSLVAVAFLAFFVDVELYKHSNATVK